MPNNNHTLAVLNDLKDLVDSVKKRESVANEFLETLSMLNDRYEKVNNLYKEINSKYIDAQDLINITDKIEAASKRLSITEQQIDDKNVTIQKLLQRMSDIAHSEQNLVDNIVDKIVEITKTQKTIDHKLTSVSEALSEPTANGIQSNSIDIRDLIQEQKEDLYSSFKKEMQKEIDSVIKKTNSNFEKRIAALVKYLDKMHNQTDNVETEYFDARSMETNAVADADDTETGSYFSILNNKNESKIGTKKKSVKNKKEKEKEPVKNDIDIDISNLISDASLTDAESLSEYKDKKSYLKAKYENIFSNGKVRKERDWIWIYDEGKEHAELLEQDGFIWSNKRGAWYYNGK